MRRALVSFVSCTRMGECYIRYGTGAKSDNAYGRLPRSDRAFQHIRTLAQRYTRTKFVSIVGEKCIPNLPDSRCPMIIVYRKGDIRNQIVAWGADRERRIEGTLPLSSVSSCILITYRT